MASGEQDDRRPKRPAEPGRPSASQPVEATLTPAYAATSDPGATLDDAGPAAAMTLPPVIVTTRYEILAELGSGGMGLVYRARDRETGETVALKVLRPAVAANPRMTERFKNELRLARQITHKNVCRIHEFSREGDVAFITMELVAGESLRHVLQRFENLSVRTAVKIGLQICAALREAHALGIIHRDLKPENVMLDAAGQAKVMDFGIARSLKQETDAEPAIIGTPAYMSPEQAEGRPADVRSDLYALGLVLYEMLTGRPGVRGSTSSEMVRNTIQETPPPPREIEPSVPAALDRVVMKCLEKDPARRFQDVDELERALNDPHFGEALEDPEPPLRLTRWRAADWVLLALGVAGLLCFLQYRERVFPVMNQVLELDAISARRAAQELATRLGRPFNGMPAASQVYDPEQYADRIYAQMFTRMRMSGNLEQLAKVELPLYWRAEAFYVGRWRIRPSVSPFSTPGEIEDRHVTLDRRGRFEEYVSSAVANVPVRYTPPALEERRKIAAQALQTMCGSPPPDLVLVETTGGERGASYQAVWRPRAPIGMTPWGEVTLLYENITGIRCTPPLLRNMEIRNFAAGLWTVRQGVTAISLFFIVFLMLVWFTVGQCHRSPLLPRRVPLAVVTGVCGAWVLGSEPWVQGGQDSLAGTVAIAIASSAFFLVSFVATEDRLRKHAPASVATCALALRGKLNNSVALAIVRGALFGLFLAGFETALSLVTTTLGQGGSSAKLSPAILLDPGGVGRALTHAPVPLFVVASVVFHALAFGFLLLGMGIADCQKYIDRGKRSGQRAKLFGDYVVAAIGTGSMVMLVGMATPIHFMRPVSNGPVLIFVVMVLGLLLGACVLIYDLLTGVAALATAVLFSLNYPLLSMLEQVGNTGPWLVFIGWGAVIAAAVAIAFREQLTQAVRQMRAEMSK